MYEIRGQCARNYGKTFICMKRVVIKKVTSNFEHFSIVSSAFRSPGPWRKRCFRSRSFCKLSKLAQGLASARGLAPQALPRVVKQLSLKPCAVAAELFTGCLGAQLLRLCAVAVAAHRKQTARPWREDTANKTFGEAKLLREKRSSRRNYPPLPTSPPPHLPISPASPTPAWSSTGNSQICRNARARRGAVT